jgi:hypothetical protein
VYSTATLLLVAPLIALSQDANHNRTLSINGQSEQVPVIQANGHSYVDLEVLVHAPNGTLRFNGNHIALNVPGLSANASASSSNQGFQKSF